MAMQPRDRQKAKHALKTAPRKAPVLVNRTNKVLAADFVSHNNPLSARWRRAGNTAGCAQSLYGCNW